MKYKNHIIKLYPPELCMLDNCDSYFLEYLEYNNEQGKKTCVGTIYGKQVRKKIFMVWEGRNKNYKILKCILDKLLENKDEIY